MKSERREKGNEDEGVSEGESEGRRAEMAKQRKQENETWRPSIRSVGLAAIEELKIAVC